jgi:type I restriction enzyme R subunit
MSPHAYTEDQLVEQPAIGLFSSLGWQTVSAIDETFGTSPPTPLPKGEAIPDLERDGSRSKYALGIHERESSFVFVEYR